MGKNKKVKVLEGIVDTSPVGLNYACATVHRPSQIPHTQGRGSKWCTEERFFDSLTKVSAKSDKALKSSGIVLWSDGKDAVVDTSDTHSIIIGSTGSQKSRRVIMPSICTLARAGENIIVADCKGELYDETGGFLEKQGYSIFNINLRNPLNSHAWNPLLIPYRLYWSDDPLEKTRGELMVYDLSAALCPVQDLKDPFWDQSGQDLLAGSILLLFQNCKDESKINLRSILSILQMVSNESPTLERYLKDIGSDNPIHICLSGSFHNAPQTRRCIVSVAHRAIRVFTSQDAVARQLSSNDIDMDIFNNDRVAIFITVPDERRSFHGVVSVFVKQSYEYLISLADRSPHRRLRHRVSYLIDEFSSFPMIESFDSMISASRSRNIRINMVVQGLDQLKARYGSEVANIILGNCGNILFLTTREQPLLQYISNLVGNGPDGRPLISTSELQRLDKSLGQALVLHDREDPFLSSLVDISEYRLPPTKELKFAKASSEGIPVFDFAMSRMNWITKDFKKIEHPTRDWDSPDFDVDSILSADGEDDNDD